MNFLSGDTEITLLQRKVFSVALLLLLVTITTGLSNVFVLIRIFYLSGVNTSLLFINSPVASIT
jgi:hypothetical protein